MQTLFVRVERTILALQIIQVLSEAADDKALSEQAYL